MIREGSASKNLYALLPLLKGNTSDKCMLVSDDRDPIDLLHKGHINHVVQMCLDKGIDFFKAICAATINPARYFKQKDLGAIAPNYRANFLILDNIKQLNIKQVYHNGKLVCNQGKTIGFKKPIINKKEFDHIFNSIDFKPIKLSDLRLPYKGKHKARIISLTSMEIISKQIIQTINFDKNNGIDLKNDILKLVVVERHHKTGHIGIGLTTGFKLKTGAIASTVAHDSHNIIVVGTNDNDIMVAINSMKKLGGGQLVVKNGKVIAHLAMPIAGLMSNNDIKTVVEENIKATKACYQLGVNKKIQPFMNMAFLSLPVIPELRLTTKGLVDVNQYKIVDLIIKSY